MDGILQPLRAYEHWLAQYKRVWRGTIGTSLVNPLLYLAALGVGLGTIVDKSPNAPAGVPYLDYIAPGLLAAAAMQTAATESSWPVMGAIKWTRTYYAMTATPLTERDVLIGHQLFVVTRVLTASAAYLLVVAAFGAVELVARPARDPGRGPDRDCVLDADGGVRGDERVRPSFPPIFRFVIVPMFLFSGTFFPVSQMPLALELLAYVTPIWHGVRALPRADARHDRVAAGTRPRRLPPRVDDRRPRAGPPRLPKEALQVTTLVARALDRPGGRGGLLFERNLMSYRRMWPIIVSGFFEPLFYLLSLGFGLGGYVGEVVIDGAQIDYATFVAPGLLAASAMNGAFYDATNVFWKLKYQKLYDAILSTPLGPKDVATGEAGWALFRGLLYAIGFFTVIVALGLVESWWALLALPATVFVGFAFAGMGVAAVTFMRSWQDFDILNLAILPMFLFSATFFPLSTYPDWLEVVIQATPLYNGVDLLRSLTTGTVGSAQLVNVAYLTVLGLLGTWIASRRVEKLLLT